MASSNSNTTRDVEMPSLLSTPPPPNDLPSSPPPSQPHNRSTAANANGKRPLTSISNGHDEDNDDDEDENEGYSSSADEGGTSSDAKQANARRLPAPSAVAAAAGPSSTTTTTAAAAGPSTAAKADFPTQTHAASGYTWSRAEDEPGASWRSKKAVDELHRALEGMVHREVVVAGKYGDPFEAVERERAVMNSLRQR